MRQVRSAMDANGTGGQDLDGGGSKRPSWGLGCETLWTCRRRAVDGICWVTACGCCALPNDGGFRTQEGQEKRAGSGRTASLELELAAHYDIPTTPRNGASL